MAGFKNASDARVKSKIALKLFKSVSYENIYLEH